jgi:hypothetical protein
MSIYATLWTLRFPRDGQSYVDCQWVTVAAQGVPAHVGADGAADPYESFLPALSASVAGGLRAVVFIVPGTAKGTSRSAQEYEAPLLVISGAEYASSSFAVLHARLCDALRGSRPKLVAEVLQRDGSWKLVFDEGSVVDAVGSRRDN